MKIQIAKINTSQMQVPPKTLNLVLAINKHLKVACVFRELVILMQVVSGLDVCLFMFNNVRFMYIVMSLHAHFS